MPDWRLLPRLPPRRWLLPSPGAGVPAWMACTSKIGEMPPRGPRLQVTYWLITSPRRFAVMMLHDGECYFRHSSHYDFRRGLYYILLRDICPLRAR